MKPGIYFYMYPPQTKDKVDSYIQIRNLALGDMLWVARCSVPSLGSLDPRNSTNSKDDDKFNSSESDDSTEIEYQGT